MEILVDTNQKEGKHTYKHNQLERRGCTLIMQHLDHGDYMLCAGRISVDTKRNLSEIWGNLKGSHKNKQGKRVSNYPRFRRECIRAHEAEHVLVVLIENRLGIHNLSELGVYKEPESGTKRRHAKKPIIGMELVKQMNTMTKEYGVLWAFCHPAQTGDKIIEYLSREDELLAHKKKVMVSNEQ